MSKEKFFRPYQGAWDRRHLKQFGTKLTAKQAERVRDACDRAGVTPYKLVQNLLLSWVQNQENPVASDFRMFPSFGNRDKR